MTAIIVPHIGVKAARDLQAQMQGQVVVPADDAYGRVRRLWNGAVDRHPALIALCETAEDVQAAVRTARAHGLPLSVRGGGHDWAGRALRHEGLVLDLTAMRQVRIDALARTATVAGGATAKDVIDAAARHDLAAVTGTVGTVGMAGLTLGGGYGPLIGEYGLALDNLLAADVVLADGRIVTADNAQNVDLFWALRGGGGNFGVVISMRIRLHRVRTLLSGLILFPLSQASSVFRGFGMAVASAPDALSVMTGLLSGPDGSPTVFLAPTWSGEPSRGEAIMAKLQRLGTPVLAQVGPMTYGDKLAMFDAQSVNGRQYAVRTCWLRRLTRTVISTLSAAGGTMTSPFSAIVLHHFHGAAARVPITATAFGLRQQHLLVEIIAAWEPSADKNGYIHRCWAESVSRTLAPAALPGGYPNMLGPDDRDQIELAYGSNITRLLDVKQRFDPDGIFTSAIPLPVGTPRKAFATVETSNFA